jgi:fructoselysine-6-P-deglycase FrlB-like protein
VYKTEVEIFDQYKALEKTYKYLQEKADTIRKLYDEGNFKSITYIGCGSSYSLCKSAEISTKIRLDIKVNSLPAGDLMLNFAQYKNMLKDTLLVAPSRSGSTSEVVMAVKRAKEELGVKAVSICAKTKTELSKIVDLSIEIPWAFDESVCQTRTVTNLYFTNLFVIGVLTGDDSLIGELGAAVKNESGFMDSAKIVTKEIADKAWDKVVVLADSELEGIAEEGALAFKEICQLPSNYYHILDVRHGPMVLIDDKTLVIVATTPNGDSYQKDLIKDVKNKKAVVVTISDKADNIWGSDYNIEVPAYKNYAVAGIPFIFVPQTISYNKALVRGINPDDPQGLEPWIKL